MEAEGTSVLVGRHSESDLQLAMPDVSRRHCRFVLAETGWRVIDLSSTNGTFVNGVRVDEADLHAGDRVRVGSFIFEMPADADCTTTETSDAMLRKAS